MNIQIKSLKGEGEDIDFYDSLYLFLRLFCSLGKQGKLCKMLKMSPLGVVRLISVTTSDVIRLVFPQKFHFNSTPSGFKVLQTFNYRQLLSARNCNKVIKDFVKTLFLSVLVLIFYYIFLSFRLCCFFRETKEITDFLTLLNRVFHFCPYIVLYKVM